MNMLQMIAPKSSGYDWATWLMGIFRSLLGGGSNGVLSGLVSMGIDPDHFNLAKGIGHTMEMMGAMFLVSSVIAMLIFLKTHDGPDRISVTVTVVDDGAKK